MPDYLMLMHNDPIRSASLRDWEIYVEALVQSGRFRRGSAIGSGVCRRKSGTNPPITARMEALAREERYPSGSYLPLLSRGLLAFERGDYSAAIDALAPLAGQNERIGGSRAQHDLIEFTLLKACLNAGRLDEAQRLLRARRPGASGVPIEGMAAVH